MSKYTLPPLQEDSTVTSVLEPELSEGKFQEKKPQQPSVLRPKLACKVNYYQDQLIFSQDGRDFAFQVNSQSGKILKKFISLMDGTKSMTELQQMFSANNSELINTIVRHLDEQNFLDDVAQVRVNSGIDTLLELEDLTTELLNQQVDENLFLKSIKSETSQLPINVIYGFIIEHYHFITQQCCFDSPGLSFQSSTKVRQLLNERYTQEYRQDQELVMAALNAIGISREQLADTMPLPETMGMCNALTYWANFEPLFFLSTLGFLAGQTRKNFEFYSKACERVELDSGFINPIRQLANSKLKLEPENLSRRIFQEIPHIDRQTKQRFRGQTYLFVEIYNNFYTAIWNHYSSASHLLRRVSAI
ncbi:MAG: hypothetical protein F6K55_34450 [Moorea sp. SIO4A3]|nr:hypothetical protein [Moorena sp. SIO4A3]